MVCNVTDLFIVILALLHPLVPELCHVGVVTAVDSLVNTFQKLFSFKGLDCGFVGDTLEPGLRVVNSFGEIDARTRMIGTGF